MKQHNGTGTRLHNIWRSMKERCNNPNYKSFQSYGGRGVTVCKEWEHDFNAFREWALANGYDDSLPRGKMTIERIDVNKGYSPENCRWENMKGQANNRRSNRNIFYNGENKTISEWSEKTGVPYQTLYRRIIVYGWDVGRAFTEHVRERKGENTNAHNA